MLAAIYLRLSRDEEQRGLEEILHHHRMALIKLAENNNFHYDLYQEVSSGMNNERPELNNLVKRIADYDYVLVMDLDRLTRDNILAEQLKQIFIMNDIKILTPTGEINFENESNELLYSFSSLLANYEWKQIRKRMSRGRLAAAGEGKWVGSNRVPLGYSKDENKKLAIIEEEAKIIRLIFEKTLERESANEIAKQLYILGWRTRNGKIITSTHISLFRRNPVYYGVVQMKRRINGKIVDEVYVENAHDPIIPKQQWLTVQKILNENSAGNFFNKRKATRRLQNLIYCDCCKRKRYIQSDGNGKDFIKSCSYKISNNTCKDRGAKYIDVENFVLQKVKDRKPYIEEKLAKLESRNVTEEKKKFKTEKQALEQQLDKFEKRQQNLLEMRMDGEITKQEFHEIRDSNEEKMKNLLQQIDLINTQVENLENTDIEEERLNNIIKTIDKLEELELEDCNAFLKTFIKKIWYSSNSTTNHNTKLPNGKITIKIEWL